MGERDVVATGSSDDGGGPRGTGRAGRDVWGGAYRSLYRNVLVKVDAEAAHRWAFAGMRAASRVPVAPELLRKAFVRTDPRLRTRVRE